MDNSPTYFSRRAFLKGTAGAIAGAAIVGRAAESRAPRANVRDVNTISLEPQFYHGWPTLARRRTGELIVAYSGGREAHICPFGRVEMMISRDNGATWSWPRILLDSAIDDRDAGILETSRGTLLVTSFTSLAYQAVLKTMEKKQEDGEGNKPDTERLQRWRLAEARCTAEQRQADLGQWMIRSTDGGMTWSTRYPSIVNSPHGPVQLSDGRLLHAGKELWTGERRVGVCASSDDGQSWQWLATIPVRPGDLAAQYHELHAVEAAPDKLIVHIRNENKSNAGETLQSESTDGGKTWSEPHSIGVWGLPSFLLSLRDGRLLMTYGYRRPPFGVQARVSDNHGETWSEPIAIYTEGAGGDLGYPSTVELDDGSFVTVWYESVKAPSRAQVRQARWSLVG